MEEGRKVILRVQRFDPERDTSPYLQVYEVPYRRGMTVLEALLYVKENLDPTLSFRYSCRMAVCGSCGMLINGVQRLACATQISVLGPVVEIKSLPNFPIIRDLVVDLSRFFEKHKAVKPYLIRRDVEEQERPTKEYLQKPEELVSSYLQFSYCIKCGLCVSACPVAGYDEQYLGPEALAQAYRYIADSRDQGAEERIKIVDSPHGCWNCHFAGSCSHVCPKGVDPALAIQLLKRTVIKRKLGLGIGP